MATIYIDNQPYQVKDGQDLLHTCLSLGFDIPYFCWHPALHSVGACRQCAVKQFQNEKDTHGKIVLSCMTPAADGTRISIDDPEVHQFRASIIEWLMANHPHDCPVCDEGGECHLQDMTVMTGHIYRRYQFPKRTYYNQDLGPFVTHEMNRCIQCYRCVRFYRDYAGGRDFAVLGAHDHVYFGRQADGTLESEFAGNLVEVCPTGVFTDKTLRRHYTRKWDLQTAPSVCVHCGVGCNTIPGERYGELRRIRSRYNGQVNGYFLCDRGRYGYEFVNSGRRVRQALHRSDPEGALEPIAREHLLDLLADMVRDPARIIGIGSPRASLEANFALRTLVLPHRFYAGIQEDELQRLRLAIEMLRKGPARSPSLHDIEECDAVLILGEDVPNVAPMIALALRQSVRQQPMRLAGQQHIPRWHDDAVRNALQDQKGPLYICTPYATRLDDIATLAYRAAPGDVARLGYAVAYAVHRDRQPEGRQPAAGVGEGLPLELRDLASRIAADLKGAEHPLVVAGTTSGSQAIVEAGAEVARALCQAGRPAALSYTVPECNSLGLAMMSHGGIEGALEALREGRADTVIVLENDLYRRADRAAVDELLHTAAHVVVIDHTMSPTATSAEVVLPAGTFAESDGTLVNNEGRAQRFYQVFTGQGEVQESWRWLRDMAAAIHRTDARKWQAFDDVMVAMAKALPGFAPVLGIAPPADFRIAGMKIARQHERFSGRTSMFADKTVHEPQPAADPDSPLAFTMEGYQGRPPAPVIPRFWAPGWNSPQAITKFQIEVGGPLQGGDPGRRLIEPEEGEAAPTGGNVPAAFQSKPGEVLVVPIYHVFGSEEQSALAPAIAEMMPSPYLALNPEDAQSLPIPEGGPVEEGGPMEEGGPVELDLGPSAYILSLRLLPSLPKGVAGFPAGLPGMAGLSLPAWGRVRRAPAHHLAVSHRQMEARSP